MTVVPIPVAPTPPEPAAADTGGADNEAAPGFANLLDAAQGQEASEGATGTKQETPTDGGDEKPPNALSDATVMALLAALTGAATPAVATAPPVVDPALAATTNTNEGDDTETAAVEIDIATASISLVDADAGTDRTNADNAPVATKPAPAAAPDAVTTDTPATGDTPDAPAPAPARPEHAAAATPVVAVEAIALPVAVPSAAAAAHVDKPAASAKADAFTSITPPTVAPPETRAAAPAAPAAPVTSAPPVPTEQVVSVLRPLRRAADGTYELRLQLRPPELGQIEIRVELRHGVLSATLHTDNPQAAEVMRSGLGELRARLDAEGVRAGALTVDSNAAQMSQRDRESQPENRDRDESLGAAIETTAPATPRATDADALLDVRM